MKRAKDLVLNFPTHCLITGQTKSGKTTLLLNIILDKLKYIDYIVLMCGTIDVNPQYEKLKIKPHVFSNKINTDILDNLIKEQKKNTIRYNKKEICRPVHACLIIDDTSNFNFYTKHFTKFDEVFKQGRQYFISCFILSQCMSGMIPPGIRTNCPNIIVTHVNNNLITATYGESNIGNKKEYRKYLFDNVKPRKKAVMLIGELTDNKLITLKYDKI